MIYLIDKSDSIVTIWSQNMLQIFSVILVELAESEDCDFSWTKLTLQKVSVSRKYKSSQEISTKLCFASPP